MEGLFTEVVAGDAKKKTITVRWVDESFPCIMGDKVILARGSTYFLKNMELEARLKAAELGLEKAIKQYAELCYDEDICLETLHSTLEKIKAK